MTINGRNVKKMVCSCGGNFVKKETIKEEDSKYGCGKHECCCVAMQCNTCRTRIAIVLKAPEVK